MTNIASPTRGEVALAARLFRSLGDPTRLALVLALVEGEKRVADLVLEVGTSQSNVSGHLACLKGCGLVVDRPDVRRQVFYRIADPAIYELLRASEGVLASSGVSIDLCRNPLMDHEHGNG